MKQTDDIDRRIEEINTNFSQMKRNMKKTLTTTEENNIFSIEKEYYRAKINR